MEKTLVPPPLQYLVKEDGQRVGVVLGWEDYETLRATYSADGDLLTGLSEPELQALAEGALSSRYQERLNELLRRNREGQLGADEEQELDRLLEQVDHMNVLKARAMYTLQQFGAVENRETLD